MSEIMINDNLRAAMEEYEKYFGTEFPIEEYGAAHADKNAAEIRRCIRENDYKPPFVYEPGAHY